MTGTPRSGELRAFVRALTHQDRRSLAWVTLVQLASTASQGLGLLLLVPLLEVAGVGGGRATGGLADVGRWLLGTVGVSPTLRSLLVAYVVIVALASSLNAYASIGLVRYRLDFVDGLRQRLYEAVAVADWKHLAALRRSEILSTITVNVGWVAMGVLALLQLGVATILVAVQLAVAVRISPWVTALAAGTGAALIVSMAPLISRSRRLGRELVDDNHGVLAAVTGFLEGLKLAKAHGLEATHVTTFSRAIRRSRASQVAFATAQSAATAVQLVVTAAVLALVVDIAVERLHLKLASLLVIAFIFSRVVPQITTAQRNIHQVAQSLPAFGDLLDVIESCEAAAEPAPVGADGAGRRGLTRGIRLEGVSFSYGAAAGEPAVLHDVTLEVPAHRTTALVGASGAGKTTLADIVVGLVTPTAGRVLVDDQPLTAGDRAAWRAGLGLVPQDPFLFHDTLRANLLWARPDATDEELWEALATAAATDFVGGLAEGLDTVVGDRGTRLSGGERQRVALARALLRRPDLLVLDEATSSLDTANERAIREALARLHGRTTMLVIAHRLSTVSHADTIVVLDHGRVVESGTWADLAARADGRLSALIDAGAVE